MPENHDVAFGKSLVLKKILKQEDTARLFKIQQFLEKNSIQKTLAALTVESGKLTEDRANTLIDGLNRTRKEKHPPLKVVKTSKRLKAALQRAQSLGKIKDKTMAKVRALKAALDKAGFTRDEAEIATDLGLIKVDGGTGIRRKGGTEVRRPTEPPQTAAGRGKKKKKSPAPLYALAGGGALLIIILIAVAMSSGGPAMPPQAPPEKEPIAATPKKTDPPKTQPKKTLPGPEKPDPEAEMRKAIEKKKSEYAEKQSRELWQSAKDAEEKGEWQNALRLLKDLQRVFRETKHFRENEIEIDQLASELDQRLAQMATKEVEEEDPEDPVEPAVDDAETKAAYEARRDARLREAIARVKAAKLSIEEERTAENERIAGLFKRVSGKNLSVTLRSGLKLDNVNILSMTRDDVEVTCEYQGARVEMGFPWIAFSDRSYIDIQKALYKQDGAAGWFEIGRQCILRSLWKDAKKAYDKCVNLDASYEDKVPDVSKILNNEASFKGRSKRVGRDTLMITYDFADAEQAQDFKPSSAGKLDVAKGEAKMTSPGLGLWGIKDVDFVGEVSVDVTAKLDSGATLVIGCFQNWERKGYTVHLSSRGVELFTWDGRLPGSATQTKAGSISGSAEIRFSVRDGNFLVSVDGKQVFSGTHSAHKKGWLLLGVLKGTVSLRNLTVSGKVDPGEIDKRFAESEILVRRALEGGLGQKREKVEQKEVVLSVEDEYFMDGLDTYDLQEYKAIKEAIRKARDRGRFSARDMAGSRSLFNRLQSIIDNSKNFPAAQYLRGTVYQLLGNTQKARVDLRAAAKFPDFYEAQAALGETYLSESNFEKAAEYADQALKLAPDYTTALSLKAMLRFVGKDHTGSIELLEIAQKLDPKNQQVRERHRNLTNVIKGPEHLGCKYEKEFPHFIVMTDISMAKTKLYGQRLEAAYAYYVETFKEFFREKPGRHKPRVAIFNTREAYLTYGELTLSSRKSTTLGYFHPLYNELLLFEEVDIDGTLHTLYHEAFHQFMNMMIPRTPFWYNEGIAEYMGAITIEKGVITKKAMILAGRLKGIQKFVNRAYPFKNIMNQTPSQFYSGPVSFKYAQAWTMVHFFYEYENGKYRPLLDAYYKALLDGQNMGEAYETAFGKEDMNKLKREWAKFVEAMEMPPDE